MLSITVLNKSLWVKVSQELRCQKDPFGDVVIASIVEICIFRLTEAGGTLCNTPIVLIHQHAQRA